MTAGWLVASPLGGELPRESPGVWQRQTRAPDSALWSEVASAWTQRVRPEACHLTLTGAPLRPLVRSGRPSPALPGFVSAVFTPKVPARPLHVRSAQYIIRERGQATGAGVRILRAAGSPKRAHPFTEDAGSRTWPEPCRTPEEAEGTAWAFVVCATGETRP